MISKFDLSKYLVRSDTIYIVVIVIGLFFLVFLDELPVRLIGACIALLAGVVLFMNLSARLKERVELKRPAPSQPVELSVKVRKEAGGTRYVFDDFESNFGGDDVPTGRVEREESVEASPAQESRSSAAPKRMRFDDTDGAAEPPVVTRRASAYKNELSSTSRSLVDDDIPTDFNDEISGMRIKARVNTSADDAALSSEKKEATPTSETPRQDSFSRRTPSGKGSSAEGEEPKATPSSAKRPASESDSSDLVEQPISVVTPKETKAQREESAVAPKSETKNETKNETKKTETGSAKTVAESKTQSAPIAPIVEALTQDSESAEDEHASANAELAEMPMFAEAVPLPIGKDATAHEIASVPAVEAVVAPAAPADPQAVAKQRQLLLAMANLIDDAEHPSDEEPRKEFDYLLSRVLMVIRSMMNARTAAFFWVNLEQDELVLETHITDAPDAFRQQRKYPLGLDMVSQIARSGRPEILTEIKPSAQSDLIPYYSHPAGTTSFVGVPVFLNHTVIGVLCADSTQDDAYDEITIGSLGHFTKLISGLTQSYTGKYDLLQSSRTLEALAHFRSLVNKPGVTMQMIASALAESSASIVESQTIGVVLFDRQNERWTLHHLNSTKPEVERLTGQSINIDGSLVSKTIFRGSTICVSPVEKGVCRYHAGEVPLDNGFFIAVPLKSTANCYGALFVEGHASQLTQRDIAILETIGEQTGIILEQIHFQKMLKKSALLDESTGLLNSAAFISRLDEELVRARDNKVPLVAVLVSIDRYNAIEHQLGQADKEEIFMHVLSLVRKVVRSYDALGRVDDNIIAVIMAGAKDNESQIWAERLRKEIAISVKEINKKRYTVTVSIGVAKAIADDNAESLLTNAGRAMELASAKTNNVVVFA